MGMRQILYSLILASVIIWILVLPSARGQSAGRVVITSPTDGATVQGLIIDLAMTVDKGSHGDNVHLYVDGKFEAIVKGDHYQLKGLPEGTHRIDAKLATRKHEELGPSASVTFTVE
jgi:hypothetical protein